MFSDIPISLSNNQDFTQPSLCGAREIEVDGRRNHWKTRNGDESVSRGTRSGASNCFRDVWMFGVYAGTIIQELVWFF